MARLVPDLSYAGSLMVVNIIWGVPYEVKEVTPLLNGSSVITRRGWRQTAEIHYNWANAYQRDNLVNLPEFGLNTLLPEHEGWSYDQPLVTEINPTIHLYNITVSAQRFTPYKPT